MNTPALKPGGVLVRMQYSVISAGTEAMKVRKGNRSYLAKARARPDKVRQLVAAVQQHGLSATYRKAMSLRRNSVGDRHRLGADARTGVTPVARNIYICWVRYQRRPESLRALLDLEVFFIAPLGQHPAIKVPCYLLSGLSMLRILLRTKPDVLWLQLAPSLLLYVAFLYKVLVRPDMLIIADCHNGLLQPRWLELPLVRKLLARCELVFFHNALAQERAKQLGYQRPARSAAAHTPCNPW